MWTDLLHPQPAPARFDRLCQQRNNGEASARWDAPYDGDCDGTWSRASSGMDCDELSRGRVETALGTQRSTD